MIGIPTCDVDGVTVAPTVSYAKHLPKAACPFEITLLVAATLRLFAANPYIVMYDKFGIALR